MQKPSLYLVRLIRGVVAIAVALTVLSVLDPALALANQRLEVTGLRVGIHSDKTRVVLDVSGDVPFLVTPVGNGDTVIVEIPGVTWKPDSRRTIRRGLIRDYKYEVNNGSSLLVLSTKGPVSVEKSFAPSPSSSGGHRIVIDLVSTGADPETHTDGTVDQKQMPADNEKGLVVAGTDSDTVTVSVTEIAQYYPRHSQMPQYVQRRPAFGNDSPAPRRSPSEIIGSPNTPSSPLDSRLYVAIRLGVSSQMDSTNQAPDGQGLKLDATTDSAGFIGAGALGLNLGSGFLLEGEVSYTKSDLKFLELNNIGTFSGLSLGPSVVDGNVTALSFMANVKYLFRNKSALTPYLIGGIGISSISLNDIEIAGIKVIDDDDLVFAYQFGAGLNTAIDERTSLDFEYRYFTTSDPSFNSTDGAAFDSEYSSHSILLGLRYSF